MNSSSTSSTFDKLTELVSRSFTTFFFFGVGGGGGEDGEEDELSIFRSYAYMSICAE